MFQGHTPILSATFPTSNTFCTRDQYSIIRYIIISLDFASHSKGRIWSSNPLLWCNNAWKDLTSITYNNLSCFRPKKVDLQSMKHMLFFVFSNHFFNVFKMRFSKNSVFVRTSYIHFNHLGNNSNFWLVKYISNIWSNLNFKLFFNQALTRQKSFLVKKPHKLMLQFAKAATRSCSHEKVFLTLSDPGNQSCSECDLILFLLGHWPVGKQNGKQKFLLRI